MATNKKPTAKKPSDLVSSVAKDLAKVTAASKQSVQIAKDIASVKVQPSQSPGATGTMVGGTYIPVAGVTQTVSPVSISGGAAPVSVSQPSTPTNIPVAGVMVGGTYVTPGFSTSTASTSTMTRDERDAFALVKYTFQQYGLDELVPAIEDMMRNDVGPREAEVRLKTDPKYNKDAQGNPIGYAKRFAGNIARTKAGLNAISESEYLSIEDSYSQILRSYGQQGLFGADAETKRSKAAELIGSDISPVELKDRVELAVNRVQNADPNIKRAFASYYPGLQDADLVSFLLNPKESLSTLTEKVKASEVAGAAAEFGFGPGAPTAAQMAQINALPADQRANALQGLQTGYAQEFVKRAEEFSRYGVDLQTARQGYAAIAGGLEQGQRIAARYGGQYTLGEAEQEVFKGNVAAQRKRKRFASLERAAFGGQTGVTSGSLGKKGSGAF